MNSIEAILINAGSPTFRVPGMFALSKSHGGQFKSLPKNIANSQPTVRGSLIAPQPFALDEKREKKQLPYIFQDTWQALLKTKNITMAFASADAPGVDSAWKHGGEVHCVSNAIREPIRK